MKKMICLALCLLLAGCSGAAAPAEPLTEEDFAIYEKGKLVSTVEDAVEADEYGDRLFSCRTMAEETFPGRELETKRGIKIGSTLQDLAKSYSGMTVEYYLISGGTEGETEEYKENVVIDDFVKRFGEYKTEVYQLSLNRNLVDGRLMEDAEYEEYQDQKIKETLNLADSIWMKLNFVLEGKNVTEIRILLID